VDLDRSADHELIRRTVRDFAEREVASRDSLANPVAFDWFVEYARSTYAPTGRK